MPRRMSHPAGHGPVRLPPLRQGRLRDRKDCDPVMMIDVPWDRTRHRRGSSSLPGNSPTLQPAFLPCGRRPTVRTDHPGKHSHASDTKKKQAWAACDSANPIDHYRALSGVVVQEYGEWEAEYAGQAEQRKQILVAAGQGPPGPYGGGDRGFDGRHRARSGRGRRTPCVQGAQRSGEGDQEKNATASRAAALRSAAAAAEGNEAAAETRQAATDARAAADDAAGAPTEPMRRPMTRPRRRSVPGRRRPVRKARPNVPVPPPTRPSPRPERNSSRRRREWQP